MCCIALCDCMVVQTEVLCLLGVRGGLWCMMVCLHVSEQCACLYVHCLVPLPLSSRLLLP